MSTVIKINAPVSAKFVGVISSSRTIVAPQLDEAGEVTKQGLVLITVRQGDKKVTASIGTAYLGAIDAFNENGIVDSAIELEYEKCVKDSTTYEDADGNAVLHTFNGNRVSTIESLGDAAYIAYCVAEEKRANLALLKDFGANTGDLVAYLTGQAV